MLPKSSGVQDAHNTAFALDHLVARDQDGHPLLLLFWRGLILPYTDDFPPGPLCFTILRESIGQELDTEGAIDEPGELTDTIVTGDPPQADDLFFILWEVVDFDFAGGT